MIPIRSFRPLLPLLFLLCGAPLAAQAPAAPTGAPVVLHGDTLFRVFARVGSFSAAERALAIQGRLERLAGDPLARVDTVRITAGDTGMDITADDVLVMTVTAEDAAAAGTDVRTLAGSYAREVARGVVEEGWLARLRIIAMGTGFALLATLLALVIIRLVNRAFGRIFAAIETGRTERFGDLKIQGLVLLPKERIDEALLWIAKVVRVGVVALLLYLVVPVVLSFFPWTQHYAELLFGYILTPFAVVWTGLVGFLPNVFSIGAISLVAWYLLRLIRIFFVGIARGTLTFSGFYADWAIPTYKIVRALVLVFALIGIWPYLPGSDSAAFQGVGVFVGLLISLGSAAAIGNMVGGVVLTYMRPFRVGDRVRIADTEGDVVEKSLLVTRIRTTKNVDITVPNSMVLGSHIVNYSSSAKAHGLILHTAVTIGYDVPWRQVHELLIAAARATAGIRPEPAPFVLQTSLDDFYVAYQLNAYTDQPNRMAGIYSELHGAIQDRFNEAGVEILSPHYRAPRDGNATTIPAAYLPPDYHPPAWRVENRREE